jgi:hypothetical protein
MVELQPSKTFSLGGPYDWLGKLYADIEDLSRAPNHNNSLRAYRTINCFLTLHHMIDWFWVALGREPINLQGRRHARVRYASIADVLLHSSATTLCAKNRHHLDAPWIARRTVKVETRAM